MRYRNCGNSGLKLPEISLGLWHNFGDVDITVNYRKILHLAFDSGVTHFDLANNYGPPPGSAEANFGKILRRNFRGYRDEMVISTKAGYDMWNGPYGNWGSKKHLVASLDQSLGRMDISYVDIFYHHRPDPGTPLCETMNALDLIVKQGKALYIGLSNYPAAETAEAIAILQKLGTPCLIHQPKYSMFEPWAETELLDVLGSHKVGCIPFSPLAQGMLTNKYLHNIPADSRAAKTSGAMQQSQLTESRLLQIKKLNEIAVKRGQTLAQMAILWLLKDSRVTSVLMGISKPGQLTDALKYRNGPPFTTEELSEIEFILK